MPSSPGSEPRPSSAGARVDEVGAWQSRRFGALRAHAQAPTELVDELDDDPLDDLEGSRYIIDRHRAARSRLVRTAT